MRRGSRGLAVVLVGAILAAGCGGGDEDEAADAKLVDNAAGAEIGNRTLGGTATGSSAAAVEEPTTMEGWEELWAEERAATVRRIEENGWGLQADGKTVLGPNGFSVDLGACSAGWSDTEGLTDTEIKLGATGPASGVSADAANINKAMSVIFDHYSEQGAFTDSEGKNRRVNQIFLDDGYDPARTIPLVDELIDSEKVFAVQTQGSPSTLRTYDKLNQRCIPHLFNSTGHPAWGDPVNHPWTTGMLLSYNIEALLWGNFIDQRIDEFGDGKVTVAALAMSNDFGKVYDQSLRAYFDQSPNRDRIEYIVEWIEPAAATVTDPMTTLAAREPDVFIEMMTGTPCAQAITAAAENGMKEGTPYKFVSSVCKNSAYVGRSAVGDASDGWWIVGGGLRDIGSPGEDDNVWVQWGRELLADAGMDYKLSGFMGAGLAFGWSWTQVLRIAGALPGGLTRSNVLIAARTIDMTPAAYISGIRTNMDGGTDAYWVEGSELAIYNSEIQGWEVQGDVIELSGKSTPCAWDQAAARCG